MRYIIDYVDYGIANRFPNRRIEINKALLQKRYKPLLKEIIAHEKAHTDKGFSSHDLWLDMQGFKNKALYNSFIIRHPSAWLQFSPFYRSKQQWYFDVSLSIFWGILILEMVLIGWLLI